MRRLEAQTKRGISSGEMMVSSNHVLFFFEHFALFFAAFFLICTMLKLPIKPRSVASPISSRRENQPFDRLMWIYVVLSSTRSSRRANRLGKIVFPGGQISDDLFVEKLVRPVCTSDDLFVWDDLSVQTICSSSSVKTAIKIWKRNLIFDYHLWIN